MQRGLAYLELDFSDFPSFFYLFAHSLNKLHLQLQIRLPFNDHLGYVKV